VTGEDIVEFVEALARIAATGGGPKALAAHLARTAGGSVLLEDAQWRHLAAAGAGEIPATGRSVAEKGASGRVQRVTGGNSDFGWLSLFGTDSAWSAELLLRLTAAAIGVELARDAVTVRARKGNFWEAALSRAFRDATSARDEAAARGITVAAAYLTVALEAERTHDGGSPAELAELRALAADTFRSSDGDLGFVEHGVALLVFVPTARALDASNAKTAASLLPKSVARRKPQLRLCGGVGTVESLLDLQAGAETARAALAIGRRVYGSGHVALYEELGAYRLLYEGADLDRLRGFATEVLAPLRSYDEGHQTELERTLKLYFKVGQNVKIAAAQLNVHRHTVFYRLRQIGEICGRSLETPQDQLTLRLAVAIDELHDSN
jgi:hypothetical protein